MCVGNCLSLHAKRGFRTFGLRAEGDCHRPESQRNRKRLNTITADYTIALAERIVHIGWPKTGNSALQRYFYPRLEDVSYADYDTCNELFRPVQLLDPLDFDPKPTLAYLERLSQPGKPLLCSFESLAGTAQLNGLNKSEIARRLKELGFQKIILTIRKQQQCVDSMYRQYVQEGGVMNPKDYFSNYIVRNTLKPNIFQFHLAYFEYERLIRYYEQLFGRENLLLLTFEELRFNRPATLRRLLAFLGSGAAPEPLAQAMSTTSNTSLSNSAIGFLRFSNRFTYNPYKPSQMLSHRITTWKVRRFSQKVLDPYFFRLFSRKKSYLKKYDLEDRVADFYREGNKALFERYGLPAPLLHYYNTPAARLPLDELGWPEQ